MLTIRDYVNNLKKFNGVDIESNTIQDGAKPKLAQAQEHSLWCFIAMSEHRSMPAPSKMIRDSLRTMLQVNGAKEKE